MSTLVMTKSLIKYYLRKKEVFLIFLFSFFPFLLILGDLMGTSFMSITAEHKTVSFFNFLSADLSVQFNIILPVITIVYFICNCVHDEIYKGYMFLYKDISRVRILNSKLISFSVILLIYFLLSFITSFITYYTSLINKDYTSGMIFSTSDTDNEYVITTIIIVVLSTFIVMLLSNMISLKFENGITLIVGILFAILNIFSSQLPIFLQPIFFNTYLQQIPTHGFFNVLVEMFILFIGYLIIIYIVSLYNFKKLEY